MEAEDWHFKDAESDVEDQQTTTENDRDDAKRLAILLDQQLKQFQLAAENAEAKVKQQEEALAAKAQAPAPAAIHPPMDEPGRADLLLEFAADVSHLPELDGEPTPDQTAAVSMLAALLTAVPWGSPLPATTFDVLRVPPFFVHSMVGDRIWTSCWGERHPNIADSHWVPYKLLNVPRLRSRTRNIQEHRIQEHQGKATSTRARRSVLSPLLALSPSLGLLRHIVALAFFAATCRAANVTDTSSGLSSSCGLRTDWCFRPGAGD